MFNLSKLSIWTAKNIKNRKDKTNQNDPISTKVQEENSYLIYVNIEFYKE